MVEAVGIDAVGVGLVLPTLKLVLLHAGLLDEMISLLIGGAIKGVYHFSCYQLAQALQGVVGIDAIG
ncbi:hypothetical protein D3C79_715180 [compost metagenome]